MAWPTTSVSTGDLISAAQLNKLPVQLATSTVAGAAVASIDFTSIPSVFKHLSLTVSARSTGAAAAYSLLMRINASGGGNYYYEEVRGTAAVAAASEALAQTAALVGTIAGAGAASAGFAGCAQIWLPSYSGAVWKKHWLATWMRATDGGTGTILTGQVGGFFDSASAINQVTILASAGNLEIGSTATLYGSP